MDPKDLEKESVDSAIKKIVDEINANADKRDADQTEKLSKVVEEKVKAAKEEIARERAKFEIPGVGPKETKQFSFAALAKGKITGDFSGCQYELELCREAAKLKDMTTGVDSAGGFIVPTQVMENEFVPLLQARSITAGLGVRQLTGLSGSPVQIPKITGATTAYWVGESPSSLTSTDMSFGQIEMRPRTLAATTKLSNRLIRMSTPAAEGMVRTQLAKDMGLKIDLAVLNGSGVSNEPLGILQASGVNTVTSFGAASGWGAYDKLIDMISEVDQDNALMGSLGWAMHPVVMREFQQMIDRNETSTTNITGSAPKSRRMFDSMPINTTLLGYKFATSTQVPTNTLVFGDWSQALVGYWTGMEFKISDLAGTNMERLQTQILVAIDLDITVTQPTAFCINTDMTGAP